MRLSLRTLLAFEDNVFDVEQHRRLEQLLPTDQNAGATLERIRSVVRNPKLGVPGLVDRQEELDPNYVAEYLDHQMPVNVQDQFESYCLSADKYLAEVASIHHILSNVLGEPARTSRECRIKCYDILSPGCCPDEETNNDSFVSSEQPKHFRPFDLLEPVSAKPSENRFFAPLRNLFFASKKEQGKIKQQASTEQKSSLWSFVMLGMLVSALLFGWQQIEKQRMTQKLRDVLEPPVFVSENTSDDTVLGDEKNIRVEDVAKKDVPFEIVEQVTPFVSAESNIPMAQSAAPSFEQPEVQPVEQTAFTAKPSTEPLPVAVTVLPEKPETIASSAVVSADIPAPSKEPVIDIPTEDPFAIAASTPIGENGADPFQTESMPPSVLTDESLSILAENSEANVTSAEVTETTSKEATDTIIAFQPIAAKQQVDQLLAKGPSERPQRSLTQSSMTASSWQGKEAELPAPSPPSAMQRSHLVRQPVMQTSGILPAQRVLGRAAAANPSLPNVVFTAVTSNSPWQLMPLPFNLQGDQYLLTTTPFRGSFELASGFRIEMIGDAKICILPVDVSGTPGIFVDYGRIVVYPLQANMPLRIETEKSRGVVSVNGTNSVLFIDTFAELSAPPNSTNPAEEQKPKTGPILGFVPKNGEQIVWKSTSQSEPFPVNTQGSVLLHSDQYRFGEIRVLPNWLGTLPVPPEDRLLAETCQRYFVESGGNGEQALTRLIQDQSPAIRALGFRLWGDLGNFDVPLTMMAEKRKEDEAIRQMLVFYFQEVMRRDAETVQRFADAIAIVKEANKNKQESAGH